MRSRVEAEVGREGGRVVRSLTGEDSTVVLSPSGRSARNVLHHIRHAKVRVVRKALDSILLQELTYQNGELAGVGVRNRGERGFHDFRNELV